MPLWIQNFFRGTDDLLVRASGDHDPEWAEFNLPTAQDLQSLLSDCARRGELAHTPESM
jgi:hypothetical protein